VKLPHLVAKTCISHIVVFDYFAASGVLSDGQLVGHFTIDQAKAPVALCSRRTNCAR
jgi:hypothetical protein